MWSKIPKVKQDDKTLRCKIVVLRSRGRGFVGNISEPCNRPARRYVCAKNGYDLGFIDCCVTHMRKYEQQGVKMLLVDRRRLSSAVKE